MSVHEQFADDLALYTLGALQGEERTALEKHLEGCASCRHELEQLRGDSALLALSTAGPKPPLRARQRLMDAVRREPRQRAVGGKRPWWAPVPWFVAAALALAAFLLWRQTGDLRARISALQDLSTRQQAQLERAREVVATLTSPDAQVVTVVKTNSPPQPQGKAIYVRDRASLVFIASNLPSLPPQRVYELWLIPTSGAPIPAGVFRPDAHGSATLINPPLPVGIQAKAFAITIEPEQGSSTPTMPIVMMGAGE